MIKNILKNKSFIFALLFLFVLNSSADTFANSTKKDVITAMTLELEELVAPTPTLDLIFIPIISKVQQFILVTENNGTLTFFHLYAQAKVEPIIIAQVNWFDIYKTNRVNPATQNKNCKPALPYAFLSKDCLKLAITKHLLNFRGLVSLDISLHPTGTYILDHQESFINEKELPELFKKIQKAISELQTP